MIPDRADFWVWREHFAEALDPRFHTIEWLEVQFLNGAVTMLNTESAAVLVEVITYPTGAKAVKGIAAGELNEIETILIPRAEQWGRDKGCLVARIESREGWERRLAGQGYYRYQTVIEKEL